MGLIKAGIGALGGVNEFESSIQKMKYPYCDCEFEMETLAAL